MNERQNISLKNALQKMKTVQEYLKTADKEQLIQRYMKEYPINFNDISNTESSINAVIEQTKQKLRTYIQSLCDMEETNGKLSGDYVLFAYKGLDNGFETIDYSLVCVQELLKNDVHTKTYAYQFNTQNEVMHFKVSETEFTQKNIEGLLANVLYNASFFGFKQERLADELRKLKEAMENIKEEQADEKETEYFKKDKIDREEERLMENVVNATMCYERYCRNKELRLLKESLLVS